MVTLVHARWVLPVLPPNTVLENHTLVLKEDKIIDLLPHELANAKYKAQATKTYNLQTDHVLIPGLVNTHMHSPMSLLRGLADDVQLEDWLVHYMWPAETKWVGEDFIRVGSMVTMAELLLSGTTCVNDMYFFPDITATVVEQAGLRACLGAPVLPFPSAWARDLKEYLDKGLKLLADLANHPRMQAFLAPHAPYTVTDEAFEQVKLLMDKRNTRVHIHVHETKKEVEDSLAQYGMSPIQRLHKLGVLSDKLIMVHMTHLTQEEIELVAQAGAHVVNCPESNLKLGSGICPVSRLLQAGVNVCLGTDGPASNDDTDLLGEMRTSALVDKYRVEDPPIPGAIPAFYFLTVLAYRMLEMGTINGARALGLDRMIGSLEIGKQADVVAVKLMAHPVFNPVNTLVYVGTNRVEYVWVDGKCLVEEGNLTTLDINHIIHEAQRWRLILSQWNEERKKVNLSDIETALQQASTLSEGSDPSRVKEVQSQLNEFKDSLLHWTFFASRGEYGEEVSKQKLEELSQQVTSTLAHLNALQTSSSQ